MNSFILSREHQAQFSDVEVLQRTSKYSLADFREEIVCQICDFPEYDDPPVYSATRSVAPAEYETVHVPVFSDVKTNCVVCYKQSKVEKKVFSYCSAPQCEGKHMHITKERNCFQNSTAGSITTLDQLYAVN